MEALNSNSRKVLRLYRKRPYEESWISLECAGAFDTAT